jgi:hypothetical protein
MAKTLEIIVLVAVKEYISANGIKLSSSDAMSRTHSTMVKNIITDAEMTKLLPFKY